jgi:hypothetical protein
VADKKALASVKVRDQLDITWTEAVLISADPAKKQLCVTFVKDGWKITGSS